jgi:hypothetical protein
LRGNDEEVSAILKTVLFHKWYVFIAAREKTASPPRQIVVEAATLFPNQLYWTQQ